jgi:hypothetical protein
MDAGKKRRRDFSISPLKASFAGMKTWKTMALELIQRADKIRARLMPRLLKGVGSPG